MTHRFSRLHRSRALWPALLLIGLLAVFLAPRVARAASINVAAGEVAINANGACSLREAIINANNDAATHADCAAGSGADTINLGAGPYVLTDSFASYSGATGLPQITTDITIEGNGQTIDRNGGNVFRLLAVSNTGNLTLNDLTLTDGAMNSDVGGGAIYNAGGTVTINDSLLSGHSATNSQGGGAIRASGGVTTINTSTLSNNQASNSNGGGGIYADNGATVNINDSTLSGNAAANTNGGAISIGSGSNNVTINGSTLGSNNTAGGGAALAINSGAVTLTNSTVSGNTSQFSGGGGLYNNGGTMTLNNTTVTGNVTAGSGGGILSNSGTLNLNRSIISGNTANTSFDSGYEIVSNGIENANNYNVFGRSGISNNRAFAFSFTPGATDFNATDNGTPTAIGSILNTTLANNGGPTQTHALVSGSPAIDFAPSAACAAAPINNVDQRGSPRNTDGNGSASANECDGGAYEAAGSATNTPTPTDTATPTNTPTDTATPTATSTPTNTPTDTATPTPTNTPTDTATPTDTNTPTNTPTDTATPTDTNTPTNTPTPTDTNTPTNTPTPTDTPTNTPVPGICSTGAGANLLTDVLGKGMGSDNKAQGVAKLVVPNAGDVVSIYGQLAGEENRSYRYARFIRPDGTFINDMSKESPAYRKWAVFWFGQDLTPATAAHWRARLIGAPTNAPFIQRAFVLYPTYQTASQYVNVFETFDVSSENHVYWDVANGWVPAQQQILALPAPLQPTTVTVTVVVVDNDRDNRPFELTITAGTASQMVTVNGPTNGNLLNLVKVTLNNVPAGTSEVVIDLVSPDGTGDSVAMIGATANYSCSPTN
jgi:hypothetical protein